MSFIDEQYVINRFLPLIPYIRGIDALGFSITFWGGGDEGQIGEFDLIKLNDTKDKVILESVGDTYTTKGKNLNVPEIKYTKTIHELECIPDENKEIDGPSYKWVENTKECVLQVDNVLEAIEELAYVLMHESNVDWYNNDGGGGAIQFLCPKGKDPTGYFNIYYHYQETKEVYNLGEDVELTDLEIL